MKEKTCVTCGETKLPEMFYTADKKCKECRKAMVRKSRQGNVEKYREYDRQRANNPERVQARKEYAQTEAGRKARRRASLAYWERHGERRAAHKAVGNAVRDGRLFKLPCEVCGAPDVEAHHEDYEKRLDVNWLCQVCHKQRHKEIRSKSRYKRPRYVRMINVHLP